MSHCLTYNPFVHVSNVNGKEYFLYKTRTLRDDGMPFFRYWFSERCRPFALKELPPFMAVDEDPGTGVPFLFNLGQG